VLEVPLFHKTLDAVLEASLFHKTLDAALEVPLFHGYRHVASLALFPFRDWIFSSRDEYHTRFTSCAATIQA
jgi:hypothetical protein